MPSRYCLVSSSLCFMFIGGPQCAGGPLVPGQLGVVFACLGPPSPGCSLGIENLQAPGFVQSTATYGSAGSGILSTSLKANPAYGALSSSASASFDTSGSALVAYDIAYAIFQDVLTIDSGPLDGTPGFLNLSYSLDGQISKSGAGNAFALVGVFAGPTLSQEWNWTFESSTSGTFSIPDPINFIYGQPFGLRMVLDVAAGTAVPNAGGGGFNPLPVTGTGSGSAHFFNTLVLTALRPTDAHGNEVAGVRFSSASGTAYSTTGVVPEPANLFLSILALSAIFIRRHRSAKRRN